MVHSSHQSSSDFNNSLCRTVECHYTASGLSRASEFRCPCSTRASRFQCNHTRMSPSSHPLRRRACSYKPVLATRRIPLASHSDQTCGHRAVRIRASTGSTYPYQMLQNGMLQQTLSCSKGLDFWALVESTLDQVGLMVWLSA